MRRLPVLVALLCVIGLAMQASAQADPRLQANKTTARRDTRALLKQLRLPPGASRSATEPTGDGAALLHPPRITTENTVGVSAWWTSRSTPEAVLAYVKAHRPATRGFPELVWDSSSDIFMWTIDGRHLASQKLQVTVATLADGQTGIMAEAESVWMVPRPISERLPTSVRSVAVTLRIGRGPGGMTDEQAHTYVLRHNAAATSIVNALDALPIAQPGLFYNCPAMMAKMPLLTLRFISGAGVALARAQVNVYPGNHGVSGWTGCDPIDFWIGGHWQTPLTSQTFVRQIAKLIGAKIS